MHICPQEVMAALAFIGAAKPAYGVIKHWCVSCYNGTHKSCDDHAADQLEVFEIEETQQ